MLFSRTLVRDPRRAIFVPTSRGAFLIWSCVGASIVLNFLLCFVNSNLTQLSRVDVISFEVFLISAAFVLAVWFWHPLMRPWVLFAASVLIWWVILTLVRGEADPKYARDIIIIPAFAMLGISASQDRSLIQKWLPFHLAIVGIMVYEAAFPQGFSSVFNIMQYYINTRNFQVSDFWNPDAGLFVSATRPDERHIFSALPIHRLSSVFLEPVSLENYAIVVATFLVAFRQRLPPWVFWTFVITDLALLVGSDGRMGATICALLPVIAFFGKALLRWAPITLLPLVTLAVVVIVETFGFQSGDDNFPGRLAYTAELLGALGMLDIMGFGSGLADASADSGIVYLIISHSILGAALGWVFIFGTAPSQTRTAAILRCGAALYLSGNLMVSYSVFSIKTATLLWFLIGYTDGLTWREQRATNFFGRRPTGQCPSCEAKPRPI
jgi:putative polymerase